MRTTRQVMALFAFTGLIASLPATAQTGPPTKTLYAQQISPVYASSGQGVAIGSITPGTPLKTSGEVQRGFQPFTLDAWSQQGDDTTLFAAQGQRIVLVKLAAKATGLKTLSTATDAYGNVWHDVRLSGYIKRSDLTSNQKIVWEKAIALYNTRCSACHALHQPSEFTANQWPKILKTMTHNAALTPEDAALVTQYIQTRAKQ